MVPALKVIRKKTHQMSVKFQRCKFLSNARHLFANYCGINVGQILFSHLSTYFISEQETVSRGSWIQLDLPDLSLYGLPLKSNEGFSTYK